MKVFVFSLPNNTGGPEALHQLADSARRQGFDAYLSYNQPQSEVVPHFRCYSQVRVSQQIADDPDTLVVLPEICTPMLGQFRRAKVLFWWLSVDNNGGKFTDFANSEICHAYQSEHARLHLASHSRNDAVPLFDYINDEHLSIDSMERSDKLNLVAFNPSKGLAFSQPIISARCHQYGFAPLANLDRRGVRTLLRAAKIYIDFGTHPGKDRLPREAALQRCLVIAGKRGAACNDQDLPIPEQYKVPVFVDDLRKSARFDLEATCSLLDRAMANYPDCAADFRPYVERIRGERAEFDEQVRRVLRAFQERLD